MTQYIYGLHNGDCEIRYIGKTNNPAKRMRDHRFNATAGVLHFPVYNWMRKYGPENIEMVIEAELSDDEDIDMHERFYIALYRNFENLLNVCDGGGGISGFSHSEKTKAKISAKQRGKTASKETKAKMSAAHAGNQATRGYKASEETKAKISAALIGNTWNRGRKHSEETKAKIARGNHTRWHVNRNIINPDCKFCQEVFV